MSYCKKITKQQFTTMTEDAELFAELNGAYPKMKKSGEMRVYREKKTLHYKEGEFFYALESKTSPSTSEYYLYSADSPYLDGVFREINLSIAGQNENFGTLMWKLTEVGKKSGLFVRQLPSRIIGPEEVFIQGEIGFFVVNGESLRLHGTTKRNIEGAPDLADSVSCPVDKRLYHGDLIVTRKDTDECS